MITKNIVDNELYYSRLQEISQDCTLSQESNTFCCTKLHEHIEELTALIEMILLDEDKVSYLKKRIELDSNVILKWLIKITCEVTENEVSQILDSDIVYILPTKH